MDKIKGGFIAVFTALSAWLGILAVPAFVLVVLNITDYFTGMAASHYRGEVISSNKGFRGIAKKICMWLLVGVGAVIDWLLMYAAGSVGIELHFAFLFGALAAVWLICNELLSILENIADIGVDLPPFLMKMVKYIKEQAESKGNKTE